MHSPSADSTGESENLRVSTAARVATRLAATTAVALLLGMAISLALGLRPVVIQTGSMGDAAPAGSLVLAGPRQPDQIRVGDVVVMRRPGRATVTHRIIGIDSISGNLVATTKGDANSTADPDPYVIGGEELISRAAIPGLGRIVGLTANGSLLVAVAAVLVLGGAYSLSAEKRRSRKAAKITARRSDKSLLSVNSAKSPAAGAIAVAVVVASAGGALGLYGATASSLSNAFSSSDCFTPQIALIQKGQTSTTSGAVADTPIAGVDPAKSFVISTVRTGSSNASDSAVGVELVGGDTIRVHKNVAGTSTLTVVEWSVVTYQCGVTVQRGSVMGNAATTLQIPTNDSPIGTAFAILSRTPDATDRPMDSTDHLAVEPKRFFLEVTSGVPIPTTHEIFWQAVRFDSPSHVSVQTVSGTIADGSTTAALSLPQSVDQTSTFVLTGARASVGSGVADSMTRAHLSDASTISLSRRSTNGPIDVVAQVVTLRDGTTVRHGIVNFGVGEFTQQVTVPIVDPTLATALFTTQSAGTQSGGQRGAASTVIGAGQATAVVSSQSTIELERGGAAVAGSFGWQVVEWGGPSWPPGNSEFRKRIDVTADGAVAAPLGYTVPVSFDHSQLVNLGISLADGTDIRVMNYDGVSWTELDRVLAESSAWNQAATTFWFKTEDAIAAGGTDSYWMFFGDTAPPAPLEDPENVWLVYETFESGTLGDFSDQSGPVGWYQADPWTARRPITIKSNSAKKDLLNFAVLVRASGVVSGNADAADIRFVDSDGTTLLDHEITSWNQATGDLEAWVTMPFLDSTVDTTIWLYSGAANAPRAGSERGVWPTTATGIWHLDTDPELNPNVPDSARSRDGFQSANMTSAQSVPGQIGNALSFDGIDDVVTAGNQALLTPTGLNVSFWFNSPNVASDQILVTKAAGSTIPFEIKLVPGGNISATLTTTDRQEVATLGVSANTWQHFALTWDGTDATVYLDGQKTIKQPLGGTLATSAAEIAFGGRSDGSNLYGGLLDEIRIYGGGHNKEWADEIYEYEKTASDRVSVGAAQSGTWFDQGPWQYRTVVSVDGTVLPGDLVDYPALVSGVHAPLAAAQPDGDDLIFTSSDGITRLPHQLESFNPLTGAFKAWVRMPAVSAGKSNRLYLYYGNPSAGNQTEGSAVFDSEFDGAWHLTN